MDSPITRQSRMSHADPSVLETLTFRQLSVSFTMLLRNIATDNAYVRKPLTCLRDEFSHKYYYGILLRIEATTSLLPVPDLYLTLGMYGCTTYG